MKLFTFRHLTKYLYACLVLGFVVYLSTLVVGMFAPPTLVILEPNKMVVSGNLLSIIGKTDPGAKVSVNGQTVQVSDSGEFGSIAVLPQGSVSRFMVTAVSKSGKETSKNIVVSSGVQRSEEYVYLK